jgi:hypothetical protein
MGFAREDDGLRDFRKRAGDHPCRKDESFKREVEEIK